MLRAKHWWTSFAQSFSVLEVKPRVSFFTTDRMERNKFLKIILIGNFVYVPLIGGVLTYFLQANPFQIFGLAATFTFIRLVAGRVKDFGLHPKWAWVGSVLMLLTSVPAQTEWNLAFKENRPLQMEVIYGGICAVAALLVFWIAIGLIKGDAGDNKYGPPPAA